jgi:hypothetical protein
MQVDAGFSKLQNCHARGHGKTDVAVFFLLFYFIIFYIFLTLLFPTLPHFVQNCPPVDINAFYM